jgi:hypothetical protein
MFARCPWNALWEGSLETKLLNGRGGEPLSPEEAAVAASLHFTGFFAYLMADGCLLHELTLELRLTCSTAWVCLGDTDSCLLIWAVV